jgi:acetyl/propionyl-CoA carboxylase alpha subunit
MLIANRGEIACRIISTCKELGISCIVIYTEEDRDSLHVQAAPEAVCLGSVNQSGGNPYQNIKLLIQTAQAAQADAIHPGYGYLSENATFAREVLEAGLIFIGPSPDSISALGDKRQAKNFLIQHAPEIPLIPGYNGSAQEGTELEAEAAKIGFPVLIKAAAGGGGKGMRIVNHRESFQEELKRAKSEAQQSFGSSDCLLEKYIERGKHIEVQIIGDSSGDILSLYDRECSIQRRHQKIIEEAPSIWMSDKIRSKMIDTAKSIARIMRYENAGTVEFIVDIKTGAFFFLEVNTRIQVEHPITEEVTGVDIVALQLYVAVGGLWKDSDVLRKGDIPPSGHAIECRLCAEDPTQEFMPDSGLILRWTPGTKLLDAGQKENVRFESALQTGSRITIFFDPMIAKIIVWDSTRERAISKMIDVLRNTICIGIKTNQLFLQSCLLYPAFAKGDYSTNFIPDFIGDLLLDPFGEDSNDHVKSLSVIPPLFSRFVSKNTGSQDASYRPFGSIRSGFRNQVYDQSNKLTDIVSVESAAKDSSTHQGDEETLFYMTWPQNKGQFRGAHYYTIQSFLLSAIPSTEQHTGQNANLSADLICHFNDTFASLHEQYSESTPKKRVRIIHSSCQNEEEKNADARAPLCWQTADLVLEHNGQKEYIYLATDPNMPVPSDSVPSSPIPPRGVFCHIPALGRNILYHHYSMLSFAESRRRFFLDNAAATAADRSRTYRSHMPCKVLRVLKQNGDAVKSGETLVVIESMKMEVRVTAAVDGKFQTAVAEGDAVGDEEVLCQVL